MVLQQGSVQLYTTRGTLPATLGGGTEQVWCADLVEYLQRLRRSGLSTDAIAHALDKATRSNYPSTSRPLVRPGAVGDVLQIQDALLAADARATRAPRVWETDFGKMKRVVSSDGCDKVKQNPNSTARDAAASDGHNGERSENRERRETLSGRCVCWCGCVVNAS
jgi:hypothetical protein